MIHAGGREYCVDPAGGVLGLLGKSWALPLMGVLGNRSVSRFNELQDAVRGIGGKVLTARLRELSKLGLVTRKVYADVPTRVEYRLTEAGAQLREALVPLLAWATVHPPPPRHRRGDEPDLKRAPRLEH
jgi:DNA-binding HxlR family transcriptional regulator